MLQLRYFNHPPSNKISIKILQILRGSRFETELMETVTFDLYMEFAL